MFSHSEFVKNRIVDIGILLECKDEMISNDYLLTIIIKTTRGMLKLAYACDPENVLNRMQMKLNYAMRNFGKMSIE